MSLLLHYDAISTFKREFFKDVLSWEHLKQGQVHIKKLTWPDGAEDDEANFWGYELEKDGTKYLLSSTTRDGTEIHLRDLLPMVARDLEKVANKGVVYHLINTPVPVRFRPVKTMSFKSMVDLFASFDHSQPESQKLLWFIGLASIMERMNCRVSSPPGCGKDSVVDILGNLIGGSATIESPTLAKLEERSIHLKWLAVNEVMDLSKEQWRIIEQFILAAGAHKPVITKHSRSYGNVGEELDISQFSLSLFYNDIDAYKDPDDYFDRVTKRAVRDRFPAFRVAGVLKEDFNKISEVDVDEFVLNNMQKYKDLLYAFTYYKQNLQKELHGYDHGKLLKKFQNTLLIPERWKINLGRLLNVIDLYCETQEEFDQWVSFVNQCLYDYENMLAFPNEFDNASKKLSKKEVDELRDKLKAVPLFKDKLKLLRGLGESGYVGSSEVGFWD